MGHDLVLQFHRADPLAARLDEVLGAVHQADVALSVDSGHVARLEPAVGGERLGRAVVVVVGAGDPGPADLELATRLAVPRLLLVGLLVGDSEVHSRGDQPHGRADIGLRIVVEVVQGRLDGAYGGQRAGLRHPPGLEQG